jgi:hypothetical protein
MLRDFNDVRCRKVLKHTGICRSDSEAVDTLVKCLSVLRIEGVKNGD